MSIRVVDHGADRTITLDQLIALIGVIAAGGTPRTVQRATYRTTTPSPTVFYTALGSDGVSVLTTRRTTGVTLVGGLYGFNQSVVGITDFIAVWDEGDVNDFRSEWIVVDT